MLNRLPEKLNKFALYLSRTNEALKIFLNEGSGVEAFLDTKTPSPVPGRNIPVTEEAGPAKCGAGKEGRRRK